MNLQTETKIRQHGELVKQIFGLDPALDPLALCRKLRRLETAAQRAAEAYCNGVLDSDAYAARVAATRAKLTELLGPTGNAVLINGDPRGYALKLEPAQGLPRDWGGYGLLAPDLTV
jgi:hypothetical protein